MAQGLKTMTCTMLAPILSAITSVDSVKTILTWLVQRISNTPPLQPCFFEIGSTYAGNSSQHKLNTTIPFFLLETNSKLFSYKVTKNTPPV